jgi:hypothetical protein
VAEEGLRRKQRTNKWRGKEIDGWMTSEVQTHTHISKIIEKRERRKIILECHQFSDRGRQDRRLQSPTVVCTGTNKETKEGKSHYCETVSPLKRAFLATSDDRFRENKWSFWGHFY